MLVLSAFEADFLLSNRIEVVQVNNDYAQDFMPKDTEGYRRM